MWLWERVWNPHASNYEISLDICLVGIHPETLKLFFTGRLKTRKSVHTGRPLFAVLNLGKSLPNSASLAAYQVHHFSLVSWWASSKPSHELEYNELGSTTRLITLHVQAFRSCLRRIHVRKVQTANCNRENNFQLRFKRKFLVQNLSKEKQEKFRRRYKRWRDGSEMSFFMIFFSQKTVKTGFKTMKS